MENLNAVEMYLITVTVFGLLIGSFLNVCIYRVPRKLSIIKPRRSFCPQCERQIRWYENIPIISWVLLRGRCGCDKRKLIPARYPLVEFLSAAAAALTYIRFGMTPDALVIYALTASLIVITFIDFDFKIIPNVISFPGITIGLLLSIVSEFTDIFHPPVTSGTMDSLIGLLTGGGFFYVIGLVYYFFSKRVGLGGGDIKLMAMIGAILGWEAIPTTIFAGSIVGSIVGIIVMLAQRSGRHTEIPFGPWLSLGAILYLFTDIPLFKIVP